MQAEKATADGEFVDPPAPDGPSEPVGGGLLLVHAAASSTRTAVAMVRTTTDRLPIMVTTFLADAVAQDSSVLARSGMQQVRAWVGLVRDLRGIRGDAALE